MIEDRFTELQARAAQEGDGESQQALWKAVYELWMWHFLQDFGDGDDSPAGPPPFGHPKPMVVRLEDKRYVACFTSPERAIAAAQHNELIHPKYGIPVLTHPRDGAVALLCRMDQGLDGVLFNWNRGEHGFFAPLGNIASMYEWYLDRIPAGLFDAFVRGVVASGAPQALERLNRRIVLMEQWFFIGDQARPNTPQLYADDEKIMALVFTDEDHAGRGASVVGGTDDQGQVPLIPTTPQAGVDYLQKLHAHSEGKVQDALFNLGSEPFLMSIEALEQLVVRV